MTVLIADDNRFFRTLLVYALEEEGFRCLSAETGNEALEILEREAERVSLVLLDLVMPGLNGFETLVRLRGLPGCADKPVMILSQYRLNELEREILAKHDVTSVLTKTASVERVLYDVGRLVYPGESERRRVERQPLSIAVTVRLPTRTHLSSTFNLSNEGMFLILAEEEPPKPGTEALLKFWIPGEDEVFEIAGRVAWVNLVGEGFRRTHPPGFGVQFDAGPHPALDAIQRFLRGQV